MDKSINTLQICIKANKIVFGETLFALLGSKKISLVVLSNDIGNDNKKKLLNKTAFYNIPVQFYKTKEDLYNIFHKNISYFGINDENLAKKFIDNLSKGGDCYGKECDK